MTSRLATCACGQLRVECSGEPVLVSLCHCLACQQRTGSAFGVAAFFPREGVEINGETTRYERSSDNGFAVTFHFCPRCGSTVLWEPSRKPDVIAVAVGCFGDRTFPAPTKEVYVERRHHWLGPIASGSR